MSTETDSPASFKWMLGRKIRSFDFAHDLAQTGDTACFIEGIVTEVGLHGDGQVFFTPTRVVWDGDDDSAEEVAERGTLMTWTKTCEGSRLDSGALQVIG